MTTDTTTHVTCAFCVGQAKAGTASLYGLLAAHHRAAHEPERAETLTMILRASHGEVTEQSLRTWLLERDRRLDLDYDIAWANQFLLPALVNTFPIATFVVLVRDPYTWLQSIVGHLISRKIPSDVRAFLDWWFKPDRYPHTRRDHALEAHGLYSIAAFLHAWKRHVNRCTGCIPEDKRLLLRTHELGRSHRILADFLGIPVTSLDAGKGLLNRGTWSGKIEALMEHAYVDEAVAAICGENMAWYFPAVTRIEEARRLWDSGDPDESATDLTG